MEDQLTDQLNFLLLSQRQIVLLAAFSITMINFRKTNKIYNGNDRYFIYFAVILFIYAISVGIKSAMDFNEYISDIESENEPLTNKKMVDRAKTWVYFTYALLVMIAFVLFSIYLVVIE